MFFPRCYTPMAIVCCLAPLMACTTATDPQAMPPPTPPTLGLNDVSVLFPLPTSPQAPGYLRPTSTGAKGALLPQSVYDEVPTFPVQPAQGLNYDRMRVVAVRFDACFPTAAGCEAQIRMVMQPISDDGRALDSALHAFYRLDDSEIAAVVRELRRLRELTSISSDQPLAVHPALLAQGVSGAYGTELGAVILRYCGEANLRRITFFLRAPPVLEEVWFFGGFEREAGTLTPLNIVGIGPSNQRVTRPKVPDGYRYELIPEATTPENHNALLSSQAAAAANPTARSAAFASFLRVENPTLYGPDALPCAGCHLAAYINGQTRDKYGFEDTSFPADAFQSNRNLTLTGDALLTPSSLRAFGWFDRAAMISQRVVNGSAAVVDDIEERFPLQ